MTRKIYSILTGILLICLSAYLSLTLPISEKGIPFTAQSLVIFVIAGLTKPKEFIAIILGYLFLGLVGLPVFAEGTSGWDKFTGASGGFLYGFIFSGLAISYLFREGKKIELMKGVAVMLLATVILFVFGLGQLVYKFGWSKALEYGLYPFWMMALVKAILSAIVVFVLKGRRSKGL